MRGVTKVARIITYYDPVGSPLEARLALELLDDGYANVNVLQGDWRPLAEPTTLKE